MIFRLRKKFPTLIILVCGVFFSQVTQAKSFSDWKKRYSKQAAQRGIPSHFSQKILKNISLNEEVIKKDRNQVTSSTEHNYHSFMKKWLRDGQRIQLGKEMLKKHRNILLKVEKKYGVDKEVIVALWGIETLYGKITGDYNVVQALASLAFDGRRGRFYTTQLNAAMRLLLKGHVRLDNFKGSWAGATGHCQFMPSNIPVFGQDFDKDGKIDLWNNYADTFASIAYLLKKGGWKKGKPIGSLIKSHKKMEYPKRRLSEIPMKDAPLVLKGANYKPLMRWNRSSLFAAFNILLINEMKK